jgi:hypothetical protein
MQIPFGINMLKINFAGFIIHLYRSPQKKLSGIYCMHENRSKKNIIYNFMRPDYPYKIFSDERTRYVFLVASLAADPLSFG